MRYNQMKRAAVIALSAVAMLAMVTATSCRDGDVVEKHYSSVRTDTFRVAVVMPLSDAEGYRERFVQTAEWARTQLQNAERTVAAELEDSTAVTLQFEWYDEDSEDLTTLASTLASRDDLLMVIGPMRSTSVELMATPFARYDKPLVSPGASSEDVIRRYSVGTLGQKRPFLWTLCETDVSQCEALLSKTWGGGARSISLLVPDDVYGKTFRDWIPFVGTEMGLTVSAIEEYSGKADLASHATAALSSGADCAICVTQTLAETRTVLEARKQLGDKAPRLLFSDAALTSALPSLGTLAEGIEGVAQYAEPSTGFRIAYEDHFGRELSGVEAQLYDAVLLAGFAATVKHATGETDVNEIIRRITMDGDDDAVVWTELGMAVQLLWLKEGKCTRMTGAGGVLRFDSEAYTSLVSSAYVHWTVYDGAIVAVDFMSTDGGNRTEATLASWNWQARQQITIPDRGTSVTYDPLASQWAVLVQGSAGWRNYRHQADVLNVYQLLKANGFPDDHIILVIADDIAYNNRNTTPGQVRARTDGPDLFAGAEVDYRTADLSPADICDILAGRPSDRLPVTLDTDSGSNVLLFWSGHGSRNNAFCWGDADYFTAAMLRATLAQMSAEGRYRKLLMLLEPCYSQNMLAQAEGLPGILALSSASSTEQSFADCYSIELATYLSDRFSNNLVDRLAAAPAASYKDLYTYLVTHTLGSHVQVSDGSLFDNLCISAPAEFVIYSSKSRK